MSAPNILLVEDDAEQTAMLGAFLDREGFVTTAVGSGEEGVERCLNGAFDAAVLDVMLPGINGIEVLREVRRASGIPIIMLTAKGDGIDRVIGLELGADDYLAKPYYPRELVARLRAVLRRQPPSPPADGKIARGALTLDPQAHRVEWRGMVIDLTLTEFNLLHALMRAGADVATKEELSLKVLGRRWQPFDRSLDVHASHLRQKLRQPENDTVEVETVRGVGYRLAGSLQ